LTLAPASGTNSSSSTLAPALSTGASSIGSLPAKFNLNSLNPHQDLKRAVLRTTVGVARGWDAPGRRGLAGGF
jgi:hypothetical protein